MHEVTVDVGTARLVGTEWTPTGRERGVLVALHPGVADRRVWRTCAPHWADAGWRVVAHDRRGFGDTDWDPAPHDHVADLVAVLDDRGIDRAVLLGNSMGADRLASDIPGARQVQLEESAHLPALDAAERFAEIVGDFLAGLEGGPSE